MDLCPPTPKRLLQSLRASITEAGNTPGKLSAWWRILDTVLTLVLILCILIVLLRLWAYRPEGKRSFFGSICGLLTEEEARLGHSELLRPGCRH